MNAITTYRPGLLGHKVINEVFDNFFNDFPTHLKASTQGYPVADIFRNEDGSTSMQFALAGFSKDEISVEVKPETRSITIAGQAGEDAENSPNHRRIAKRAFERTYVNYDDNLDLASASAEYENGLLTVTVPVRPEAEAVQIKIR